METLETTERVTVGLIKNREELNAALKEFDSLMDLGHVRSPSQDDRYMLLALVIEHYESERSTFGTPDPVDMIEFEMDQRGLRQQDLVCYLGSRSRVSEILNRKRRLTLKMMRKLHEGLGIPLEILVRDYELNNGAQIE